MDAREAKRLRSSAWWCALAAMFFGSAMMCSVIAQVDGIPAVAPWRHRFPDFAEAVETIRHGENLSLRLTAQVALEDQIVDALRLLQHARTALESDSAERSLQRIRKALK